MGSYHVFTSIARFNRPVSKNGGATSQGQVNRSLSQGHINRAKSESEEQMGSSQVPIHVQRGSYASAVNGDTGVKHKQRPISTVCSLQGTKICQCSLQFSVRREISD